MLVSETALQTTMTINYPLDRLHVETTGPRDGEPVLLLHGWGSHSGLMRPIAEALSDTYRVYNVDLPGHGLSPPPPEPWGVPEYAALVTYLLEANGLEGVTCIGHSNGGRIALYLAASSEAGPRIRRLVLISPSGIRPRRTLQYYVKSTIARTLKAPLRLLPPDLREQGLRWLHQTILWEWLGSSDYRQATGVMRATFVRTVNYYFRPEELQRIHQPVLIFWGEHDEAISREQMETLQTLLPDAGLVVLPEAGHYGYLDQPELFLSATRHFLQTT